MKYERKLLDKNKRSDWIDQAAMAALQGILASDIELNMGPGQAAKSAYNYAEALWLERIGDNVET